MCVPPPPPTPSYGIVRAAAAVSLSSCGTSGAHGAPAMRVGLPSSVPREPPDCVALADCRIRDRTPLIITACQVRYQSHLWDNCRSAPL